MKWHEQLRDRVKEYFENISQTLFFRNALMGFGLVLISILFAPQIFFYGILSSLVGFAYSTLYRTPHILRKTGLMTINGFFFGIALSSLMEPSWTFWIYLILGSLSLPLVTKAFFEVLQHWKLSPLIAPYILAVWILCLCSPSLMHSGWHATSTMNTFLRSSFDSDWTSILVSTFQNLGQIFFFPNSEYGLGLLILVTLFQPRRGFYFLLGTLCAVLVSVALTNQPPFLEPVPFSSYSAGLVGLGLASLSEKFNWKTILLFCAISVFLTMAVTQLLSGLSLPPLSLPFVLTFWFAQLSRMPRVNLGWAPSEVI